MQSLFRLIPVLTAVAMLWACGAGGSEDTSSNESSTASISAGDISGSLPTGPNGAEASIGKFSDSERKRVLAEGTAIWRMQRLDINGINKGACANCHSADGLDLALWKFADDDIRRRAHLDGVTSSDREKLVAYFAALRQTYGLTRLKDVENERPFQPAGQPFTGTQLERDLKYAYESLGVASPTLVHGVVDTLDKAFQVKREILASEPLKMKIGIDLPRMSEDCFRGAEHCSLNDWMADVPRIPKASVEAQWFRINDDYIADPTDANMRKLLVAVQDMTDPWLNEGQTNIGLAGSLGSRKFLSMQILQHFLRRQQLGLVNPSGEQSPLIELIDRTQGATKRVNDPFVVGDIGFKGNWPTQDSMPKFVHRSLGITPDKPLTDDDIARLKQELVIPWWWLGFMFDTSLKSGGSGREYFFASLTSNSPDQPRAVGARLPFHALYVVTKHGVTIRPTTISQVEASNAAKPQIALNVNAWNDVGGNDIPSMFATFEARQLYRRIETNWVAMWLLLTKEQMERYGVSTFSEDDLNGNICASASGDRSISSLRRWVSTVAAFDATRAPQLFGLYNEINLMAGCGLQPLTSTYVAGLGAGLRTEWFEGAGDEFGGRSSALVKKIGERVEPFLAYSGPVRPDAGYYDSVAKEMQANSTGAFSVRGTGTVLAPVTGEYEFFLTGGFGRLNVAGIEIYSKFRFNEDRPVRLTVSLQAGQRYPITFERHGCVQCGMTLEWKTVDESMPRHKIPQGQFYAP